MAQKVRILTEISVEKAKPRSARYELADGSGLYLVVHPSGAKSWAVRYRADGRPRKYTIPGSYPAVGLKAARKATSDALALLAHGKDPGTAKKETRRKEASTRTEYRNLVPEFLDRYLTKKRQRPRARTLQELARLLGFVGKEGAWTVRAGGLAEKWGKRPVSEITKGDVQDVLDRLVERGIGASVNRLHAALHLFFGWCLRRDLVAANPAAGIDQPVEEKSRDRVLSDDELRLFWKAADAEGWPFGALAQFLALTGQRRDEARGMTWGEIEAKPRLWTIPGTRTKNAREHTVPLAASALAILDAAPRIRGKGLIFTITGKTPVSGLSRAKARLDANMAAIAKAEGRAKIPSWVTHDLRRTVASGLARLGTSLPVIEKILNHSAGSFGGIVGVYQHHDFADEKRAALDAWARHVENLVHGGSTVVELRGRRR